jgi:hypothetical protein
MAPAISRRKRQPEPRDDAIPETIFDSINPKRGDAQPSVADLMARLATMNERLDASERERSYESVRAAPPPQAVPVAVPEEPKLNLQGLPDPVVDKDAYAAEIVKRSIEYQNSVASFQKQRSDAATPKPMGDPDALWDDFIKTYPDYAADETRIRFATAEVAKKLGKKGVDAQRYMFLRSDQFFKDITKEYDDVFGAPADDDEAEPPRRRKVATKSAEAEEDDETGRDAGIFGGQPLGSPETQQAQERSPVGDMIKDIHDLQRKSGYY